MAGVARRWNRSIVWVVLALAGAALVITAVTSDRAVQAQDEAEIRLFKVDDTDNDGAHFDVDDDERLEGVKFELYVDGVSAGTTTTSITGTQNLSFYDVLGTAPEGAVIVVCEIVPDDYSFIATNLNTAADPDGDRPCGTTTVAASSVDAGNLAVSFINKANPEIRLFKFDDTDNDGAHFDVDDDERLAGVEFELYIDGVSTGTTTTSITGTQNFNFYDVLGTAPAGAVITVCETVPDDYSFIATNLSNAADPDGDRPCGTTTVAEFNVDAGNMAVSFINKANPEIRLFKFDDTDNDGELFDVNDDERMAGVEFELYVDGISQGVTTTSITGTQNFNFYDVLGTAPEGAVIIVCETVPTGSAFISTNLNPATDPDGRNRPCGSTTVIASQVESGNLAVGFINGPGAEIRLFKFDDTDNDGFFGFNDDERVPGVEFELFIDGISAGTTTTTHSGTHDATFYDVMGSAPEGAEIIVCETVPEGYTFLSVSMAAAADPDDLDRPCGTTVISSSQVEVGEARIHFLNKAHPEIRLYKFDDTDDDGFFGFNDDERVPGVEFELFIDGISAGTTTTTHSGTQDASFYDVMGTAPEGAEIIVCETVPAGYAFVSVSMAAAADPDDLDRPCGTTVISSSQVEVGEARVHFLNEVAFAVQTVKFDDLDNDGVLGSDPLLEGWEFVLYDDQGNVRATAASAVHGDGTHADLGEHPEGEYTICETPQPGWINTEPGALTDADPENLDRPCVDFTITGAGTTTVGFWNHQLPPEPSIDIRKQAEGPDSRTVQIGDPVTFEIEVTNTGDAAIEFWEVSDPQVPDCDRTETDDLPPGDSVTYTCTLAAATGSFTNIATVTGLNDDSPEVTDSDESSVVVAELSIHKETEGPDSRTFPSGSDVMFTISVFNTGDADFDNVTVSDPLAPSCDASLGTIVAGSSATYACTVLDVTEGFTNVATVTGDTFDGQTYTASDESTVVIDDPAPGPACHITIEVAGTGLIRVTVDPPVPGTNKYNVSRRIGNGNDYLFLGQIVQGLNTGVFELPEGTGQIIGVKAIFDNPDGPNILGDLIICGEIDIVIDDPPPDPDPACHVLIEVVGTGQIRVNVDPPVPGVRLYNVLRPAGNGYPYLFLGQITQGLDTGVFELPEGDGQPISVRPKLPDNTLGDLIDCGEIDIVIDDPPPDPDPACHVLIEVVGTGQIRVNVDPPVPGVRLYNVLRPAGNGYPYLFLGQITQGTDTGVFELPEGDNQPISVRPKLPDDTLGDLIDCGTIDIVIDP